MERQSNKHNPRLDDEMKKEVAPFTTGEPADSRADEGREKEGPADGEPTPDAIISLGGDPYPGGERLTHEELELRHDLARYIERRIFPAEREEVVASARRMRAPREVIERLERLPSGFYDGFPAVWESLHPSESRRWRARS
jgi:hypothetical protein